ncbi:hypothetical protein ABH926_009174 [Catenulispora sp. GP43]|uniref:serine/threonine protein kinase n=1 Tax=Catenulispora sp. GP43 TaxID=3156263 RepID=UPI00351999BA
MTSLIIQLPDRLLELAPDEEATFGRGGRGAAAVDVPFDDPAVSRLAGRIRAVDDYWTISNLSSRATYIVENPEGGGEFVKVAQGRLDMPVPFEISKLVVPGRDGQLSVTIFAPEHVYVTKAVSHGALKTQAAFLLNESAKYFLVLVALCEPRLRDGASVVLPSVPQIVERLRGLESCRDLTRSAINFHIDYLARTKLRVRDVAPDSGEKEDKADWQRAALVSTALRFNLVREEHLSLLPSRTFGWSAVGPAHPQMIETIAPGRRP